MKDEIFNDLIESIKSLPTHVLKEMENNMKEDAPEITEAWVETATISCGTYSVRKQFEEFARNHPHLSHVRMKRNKLNQDIYFDKVMQTAWEVWQASREKLA